MSGGRWHEARRAWARLAGWDDDDAARRAGAGAIEALADIGCLRRLLDEAELAAVRAARKHKRSWAEIATKLGVTRQSAWERWRDLDETSDAGDEGLSDAAAAPASAANLAEWATRRRGRSVSVPCVIGMRCAGARGVLEEHGLVPVGWDAEGMPFATVGWPDRAVVAQGPEPGAKVRSGTSVRLWPEAGGGGAGVREPRRPSPSPRSGREMLSEPIDEAVSG